jgi:hypothetical protein
LIVPTTGAITLGTALPTPVPEEVEPEAPALEPAEADPEPEPPEPEPREPEPPEPEPPEPEPPEADPDPESELELETAPELCPACEPPHCVRGPSTPPSTAVGFGSSDGS